MSDTIQRIGLLTGGGDCPGLNAVIRAAVKTAINEYGWEVLGIEDGFEGLIKPHKARLLDIADVRGLLPRGGTMLGSTNRANPFHYEVNPNGAVKVFDVSEWDVMPAGSRWRPAWPAVLTSSSCLRSRITSTSSLRRFSSATRAVHSLASLLWLRVVYRSAVRPSTRQSVTWTAYPD